MELLPVGQQLGITESLPLTSPEGNVRRDDSDGAQLVGQGKVSHSHAAYCALLGEGAGHVGGVSGRG